MSVEAMGHGEDQGHTCVRDHDIQTSDPMFGREALRESRRRDGRVILIEEDLDVPRGRVGSDHGLRRLARGGDDGGIFALGEEDPKLKTDTCCPYGQLRVCPLRVVQSGGGRATRKIDSILMPLEK